MNTFIEDNYRSLEADFEKYLSDSQKKRYKALRETPNGFSSGNVEYCHRWSGSYVRRFFFRLWCLQRAYRWFKTPVTFATITTSQEDFIEDQVLKLKEGFKRILLEMRRKKIDPSFLAAMDFHKTGYGHYHVIFFQELPLWFILWVKEKWGEWGYGNKEHGLDFRIRENGRIVHIVNYLFKHTGKIFTGKDKPGWLRFHAVIWAMQHCHDEEFECPDNENLYDYPGVRLFSMSKDIAQFMKMPPKAEECIRLVEEGGHVLYSKVPENDDEANEIWRDVNEYVEWFNKLKF